ncbi:MAG: MotA/TolQ/ExbB proton channel family protein [Victivallales bacterium]|nr:MotA/TolQ/ExbB proton channel family protein [Victivallales bacterium]
MLATVFTLMTEAGAYYAFSVSDFVGRSIVIALLVGSVVAWSIMIEKGITLKAAKKESEKFRNVFRNGQPIVTYIRESDKSQCPLARIYEAGAEKLLEFYNLPPEQILVARDAPKVKLTGAQMDALRTVLEGEVSSQIQSLEDKIGWLATAVSASPLFGLFGTVWGIMYAFCSLAIQGKADIAALAPGIAGALLTTVVGLVVAIPSLLGYNMLTLRIRSITVYIDNFVEEFMWRLKLEQLD